MLQYLQEILKVVCRKLLHLGGTVCEPADGGPSEGGDQTESEVPKC
jgi:hypothetical protein